MIIVRLMGGLGNQMFQYALGRCLSLKHKTTLRLDLSFLLSRPENAEYTFRNYELQDFNIIEDIATIKDLKKFNDILLSKSLIGRIEQKFRKYRTIDEPYFHFSESILLSPKNTYLNGYWQSEKYFSCIENIIRNDFTLKSIPGNNASILESMRQPNSISIHIRRGDYFSNPLINSFLGICSFQYYYDAVKLVAGKIKDPRFFIFSDDIEWAKQNIKLDFPVIYLDCDNKPSYDLFLMSQCSNNIIANSSFSWWAAWLNNKPDKIVVAPRKWFADTSINISDRIPEEWIKI
jgi:hypothetical protein